MCSTGKVAGDGRPPAKEMTSGRIVTFRISRMAELSSFCARRENCHWSGAYFSLFMQFSTGICAALAAPGMQGSADFSDQVDLDAGAQRNLRHAEGRAGMLAGVAENFAEQFGGAIGDQVVLGEIAAWNSPG